MGIKALKGGLMLSILRDADGLRDPKPYFENINAELNTEAVGLAKELIEAESGPFEPDKGVCWDNRSQSKVSGFGS